MHGFMRSKDGESACADCQGEGCHKCQRTGKIKRCPSCGAQGESITKDGNDFTCMHCNSVFDSAGNVSEIIEEVPKKKAPIKKKTKRK